MDKPLPDYLETVHANPLLMGARLSDAGFEDISGSDAIAFSVMVMNHWTAGDLARELGMTEQAISQTIDALTVHGYLEFRNGPDGHPRPDPIITKRGRAALAVFREGVMAARWAGFPFREGDIVIACPPKSGTTWVQMICALLIFTTPDLPGPLSELSPWLDGQVHSRDSVYAKLAAQEHRRFIKCHLPLSVMPINPEVAYIAIARHPLDTLISLFHQMARGRPPGDEEPQKRPTDRSWLLRMIDIEDSSPEAINYSLPGIMRRLRGAWALRDEPNVLLMHYEDLSADLEGEMRRVAAQLGIEVPPATWPALVKAATFDQMRAAADQLKPLGAAMKDYPAFFRKGTSGSGAELLSSAELAHYYARAAELAPPDLLSWLHRDKGNATGST